MTTPTWKDAYRGREDLWSLDEFLRIVSTELARLSIERVNPNAAPFEPKERLVRYYTSEGVIAKPAREGKEVRYGYQHLLQFLVTRLLLNDGWPLSKVAAFIASRDPNSLESMLPNQARTQAELEIADIKRSQKMVTETADLLSMSHKRMSVPDPSQIDEEPAPQAMMAMQSDMTRSRSFLGEVMRSADDRQMAEWRDSATIDLTPWCRVIVDLAEVKNVQPSSFQQVGQILTHALRELRMTRRERK